MSTYGLAIVADMGTAEEAEALGECIEEVVDDRPSRGGGVDYDVEPAGAGVRLAMIGDGVVTDFEEDQFFAEAPVGRAVLCEDLDEYGVVFHVWRLDPSGSECVYRTYVQAPDGEREPSLVARVIDGPQAAAAAAALYGIDPTGLLALEEDPSPVAAVLGVIGSPFLPWLSLFDRGWPELR